MDQLHMLFSSGVLDRDHNDFGTTPNMAPPSSLKFPASIVCICIFSCFLANVTIRCVKERVIKMIPEDKTGMFKS